MVDAAIETLVGELAAAWNRGDAVAFAKRSPPRSAPPIQWKLLLVLARDSGDWSIAAFHNTAVQAAPVVR